MLRSLRQITPMTPRYFSSFYQLTWLQPGIWAALTGSSALISTMVGVAPALAGEVLSSWQFDPIAQQLTLTLPKQITPTYRLSADGRAILVDLPHTRLGPVASQAHYQGPIRQVDLTQVDLPDRLEVRLELDKATTIRADQIQLRAMVAGDQTRWTLTTTSLSTTGAMVVSLPTLPADPNLAWPYRGVGRFSVAAANLMLPGNLDSFNQLPPTQALESVALKQPESPQISVPSLEELDRAVALAPVATQPLAEPDRHSRPPAQPSPALAQVPQTPITQSPKSSPEETRSAVPGIDQALGGQASQPALPTAVASAQPTLTSPSKSATPAVPALPPLSQEPISPQPIPAQPAIAAQPVSVLAQEPPRSPATTPSAPISFGTPLPGSGLPPLKPGQTLPPDVLIASGTVLELRYPGPTPLALNRDRPHHEVLVLAKEIRDPVTNGVIAPAGSQLVGQFETQPDNSRRWVSRLLIIADGKGVPLASTSGYLVGAPQVSGNTLALGAGVGAIAVTILGGLSGAGLLGGALLGATTSLSTVPQTLVIEPNQVIYARVMTDIPRSLPIALAPTAVQPWGTQPNW